MLGGRCQPLGPLRNLASPGAATAPPPLWAVCCQKPAGVGAWSVWGCGQVPWAVEVGFSAPTHPWAEPDQAWLDGAAGLISAFLPSWDFTNLLLCLHQNLGMCLPVCLSPFEKCL